MNKEEAYDTQISPLMTQIITACKTHGIAMLASFAIPTPENIHLCCTTHLPDGDGKFHPPQIKACELLYNEPASLHIRTTHSDGSAILMVVL